MSHLLDAPHHDGSALHLPDGPPRLGSPVTALVRVPRAAGVTRLHARAVHDGEPAWTEGRVDRETTSDVWWRVPVTAVNPDTRYRFLTDGGPRSYRWLNGSGTHDRDIPDTHDFRLTTHERPPAWLEDAVGYQVFPDRFARSSAAASRELPDWAVPAAWDEPVQGQGPLTPRQVYGGDLDGVREHLDHVQRLGATVLYLTPVFQARSNHRYDAVSFEHVDPLLGGDAAYEALCAEVHRRGMRLVADLTANHVGSGHDWFRTAQVDPSAPERGFFFFADGSAGPDPVASARDRELGYAAWMGVASLPKLDHSDAELRRRLVEGPASATARWLRAPYEVDGWRVDVANMTGRRSAADLTHDVARTMRATMRGASTRDPWLLAEHGHDPVDDLAGDGWHGTMAYAWFTRPVWSWLRDPAVELPFLGLPTAVPRLPGSASVATWRDFTASVPWQAVTSSMTLLGSHDTARVRTVVGGADAVHVAAALLFTLPGVPTVFAGDEIGLEGELGEDSRRPMPWHATERWDTTTLARYTALARLRATSPALRRGGLRWAACADDAVAFLRESAEERLLVLVARAPHEGLVLPAAALGLTVGEAGNRYGGAAPLRRSGDSALLRLPGDGPDVQVWSLPRG